MKHNVKLWKCHGVKPTTLSCTNSIIGDITDKRLTTAGRSRWYSCEDCLNKFEKHMDKFEAQMFQKIFGN